MQHDLQRSIQKPHGLYSPGNSPGQNTGVGSLSLLQGSNPGLPHCRRILYQLSHQGSPEQKNRDGILFHWQNQPAGCQENRKKHQLKD